VLKYALRYVPLLILALLLVPLRFYIEGSAMQAGKDAQNPAFPPGKTSSPFNHYAALYSIAALPHGDAWAVGGSFSAKPAAPGTPGSFPVPSGGMILHYTDNAWSAARVAEPLRLPLFSVSLDSPQDGWAVGWAGTLVHYNGNQWSISPGPANFKQNLLSVVMLSSTDGWAVGYSGTILHYDGKQWVQVLSSTTEDLRSIALPSRDEGWAVGDSGTILHYHNGTWSLVSPAPTSSTLNSVSMLSTNEGWAVGRQSTILHYRDGTWESVHPASYYQNPSSYRSVDFSDVMMNSMRSGWIAGGRHLLTYSSEAWIEQGNITNQSNLYPGITLNDPSLSAITMSPTGDGWAVGSIDSDKNKTYSYSYAGIILHYQAGKWDVSLISGSG